MEHVANVVTTAITMMIMLDMTLSHGATMIIMDRTLIHKHHGGVLMEGEADGKEELVQLDGAEEGVDGTEKGVDGAEEGVGGVEEGDGIEAGDGIKVVTRIGVEI